MPSVFDPSEQHDDLDAKLVAGLERLGQALRSLQRDEAQRHGLSPLQLQLLIQLRHQVGSDRRVTSMAERFDVRSPTISDAVATLIAKGLAERRPSAHDRRVGELAPTEAGSALAAQADGWAEGVRRRLEAEPPAAKRASYALVTSLIAALFDEGVLSVARLCRTCRYLEVAPAVPAPAVPAPAVPAPAVPAMATGAPFRCGLLQLDMDEEALRLDCPEHEVAPAAPAPSSGPPG